MFVNSDFYVFEMLCKSQISEFTGAKLFAFLCHLLINFAVWTQIRPNKMSGPNLDLNCLVFLKELFEKVDFEKKKQTTKLSNRQRDNEIW